MKYRITVYAPVRDKFEYDSYEVAHYYLVSLGMRGYLAELHGLCPRHGWQEVYTNGQCKICREEENYV